MRSTRSFLRVYELRVTNRSFLRTSLFSWQGIEAATKRPAIAVPLLSWQHLGGGRVGVVIGSLLTGIW